MLSKFVAYQEALKFYALCEKLRGETHLRNQLIRASSSIALNLAEGSCQPTARNRARFYRMALGSLRESEAALDMMRAPDDAKESASKVGGLIYKLCKSTDAVAESQP